jgi:hypothetical protein
LEIYIFQPFFVENSAHLSIFTFAIPMAGKKKKIRFDADLPFEELIRSIEQQIKDASTEMSFAFSEDGELVLSKDGGKHSIKFSNEEQIALKDTIFTHNHPDGSPMTVRDLLFAAYTNLLEMRAVTQKSVYSVKPNGKWKPWFEISEEEDRIMNAIKQELKSEQISIEKAKQLFDEAGLKLAEKFGYKINIFNWDELEDS